MKIHTLVRYKCHPQDRERVFMKFARELKAKLQSRNIPHLFLVIPSQRTIQLGFEIAQANLILKPSELRLVESVQIGPSDTEVEIL